MIGHSAAPDTEARQDHIEDEQVSRDEDGNFEHELPSTLFNIF